MSGLVNTSVILSKKTSSQVPCATCMGGRGGRITLGAYLSFCILSTVGINKCSSWILAVTVAHMVSLACVCMCVRVCTVCVCVRACVCGDWLSIWHVHVHHQYFSSNITYCRVGQRKQRYPIKLVKDLKQGRQSWLAQKWTCRASPKLPRREIKLAL